MKWLLENWPKATIFLAIYVTLVLVLFVRNQDYALYLIWLQTPVYFLHQFEEYVFPGGFLKFFNRNILKSAADEFPMDKAASFNINVPLIFIAFPISAILSGQINLFIGIWTAAFSIMNAASHVGMFFRFGYNPGFVVSLLVNIPVGVYTLFYFYTNRIASTGEIIISCIIGLLILLTLPIYGFGILKPKTAKKTD